MRKMAEFIHQSAQDSQEMLIIAHGAARKTDRGVGSTTYLFEDGSELKIEDGGSAMVTKT